MSDDTITMDPSIQPETAAFLDREHGLFIGGDRASPRSGEWLETLNPATGQPLARFAGAGPDDIDAAVAAAREAFETGPWPAMNPSARSELLWKLADAVDASRAIFAELEMLDNGMPLHPAAAMAPAGAVRMLRYYAGWPGKITGRTIPADMRPDADRPALTYTRREPVGVVGQITPWNYPLGMAVMKLGPALAAGCTVVLKPDEHTPLSALLLAELIRRAGFPPGVVNVVPGIGAAAGAPLTAHAGVDKVAFTGSTDTGRDIVQAAAGNLKRVSLELGGKSPFIVFPDADLDKAISTAARLGFFLQGQNCQCPSRLLIHEDVFDRVVDGVAAAARAMRVGPGWEPDAQLGPLISAHQRRRVEAYVASGRSDGAELVTGGGAPDRPGYFFEPTLFAGTHRDMRIVREEIFGPVLCAQRFSTADLDEVADLANDTPYGLVASVWTRDLGTAHELAERIRAGTVGINHHGGGDVYAPFGGFKESGWGREFGSDSLNLYLETKTVVVRYG
ncbi:MAG: aldehyde dehydrogenase family protein [Gammaproteobacteria bacterium]